MSRRKMADFSSSLPSIAACCVLLVLLLHNADGDLPSKQMANITVATDGTGDFRRIGDAMTAAPNRSNSRFVIYIKAGVYRENVRISKDQTNIVLLGDGIGRTIITANLSATGGIKTLNTATVAVDGLRFMAMRVTFENSAGPTAGQAVALVANAEHSTFYHCSFMGYQDTLYARKGNQFYRECDIYGTVDFIFGDAIAIFQTCNLYARRASDNVFTAQGRERANEASGTVFHNCTITSAPGQGKSVVRSYLGRPWRNYSRTVVMQSFLDDLIDPKGWLEWNGSFALDTLYYAEYRNKGPGANTASRVKWPGFHILNNSAEAQPFTVASFIDGNGWLPSTGVPYHPGLL